MLHHFIIKIEGKIFLHTILHGPEDANKEAVENVMEQIIESDQFVASVVNSCPSERDQHGD